MPDRVLADELLHSERWLELPSDTHRLVYPCLLLIADDYGNLEGGPRRLYRWMVGFSSVKSEAHSAKIMADLEASDLVMRYEVEGREYWHIRRFKNSRHWWRREVPQSPHEEDKTRADKQRPASNRHERVTLPVSTVSGNTSVTCNGGVGVGVIYKEGSGIGDRGAEKSAASEAARQALGLLVKRPPEAQQPDEAAIERNREAARKAVSTAQQPNTQLDDDIPF